MKVQIELTYRGEIGHTHEITISKRNKKRPTIQIEIDMLVDKISRVAAKRALDKLLEQQQYETSQTDHQILPIKGTRTMKLNINIIFRENLIYTSELQIYPLTKNEDTRNIDLTSTIETLMHELQRKILPAEGHEQELDPEAPTR